MTKEVEAYARVTRVLQYREGRYDVTELFLSDIFGTFRPTADIESTVILENGDTKLITETVYPVLQCLEVLDSGSGYSIDQEVIVTTNSQGSGAKGLLETVSGQRTTVKLVRTKDYKTTTTTKHFLMF